MWTDVDNARSGGLPFVFDKNFGFERYVDYAMDVPMYFVYRCACLHDLFACMLGLLAWVQ